MATAATARRLGPADHGLALALEDFVEAEFLEGHRYELARGILEVSKDPGEIHGVIVWLVLQYVARYDRDHPGVIQRAGGGAEYQFLMPGMASARHPDVAVALRNAPRDARGQRPASLAVEVVSEGHLARERDYVVKRAEYLAYGLQEYWIVDPQEKSVTVLARDGDAWAERACRDDQEAVSLVLPGLVVRPADLWAAAEEREGTGASETGGGNGR